MDVLIVSKTHMASNACVGGILIKDGTFVRLLDEYGNNLPENNDFEIRDIWEIEFDYKQDVIPPHVEDILVRKYFNRRILSNDLTMLDVLKKLDIKYWEGEINYLFDGCLNWTEKGSGYISRSLIPNQSVGFWITNKDLFKLEEFGKIRYSYENKKITYVGFKEPIEIIPAGTLLRVSLARWWAPPDSDIEERCYLQLSGWYDLEENNEDLIEY